ncbi:hypothetical protein C9374_000015 [Naegleria lovaniensis]|uniref:RGS domain-containing protein n=1 Tax=Naegleria lovaniensis TaxID=51637 RepID=A0AA88GUC9_NAELO|nr:uncharacterized protein C9374_000015 [Naegleria lovaniensis]KAG2388576.1 hypothetical protein C9374_000015 [Naegleria lovaniensis]
MRVWSEPCRIGNVFEQHDAVVMDPYDFAFYLRTYRDRTQQSTTASQNYINTNDFIPIPLIPNTLIVKSVKNTWSDNTNLLQNQTMGLMFDYADMTCLNADVADAQTYRFLTGYSNFTQQDAELVRYISRKAISYDWRVYNHYMPLFLASHNLTSPNWNLNAVVSSLFPSTCHPCGADTLCLSKIFRPETDSGIFPQFIIFILYFVLLFATGSYKIPAFKRRLLVPYTPLLLFIVFLMFCNFLVRLCSPIFHFVSMIIYTWFFLIYFFSVVRFYYLRNLYTFISKSRHKKLLKILATNRVGLFITGFLSFMMSVVFSSIGIYIFFGNSIEETNTFRVIFLFVIIILGSILALIAISFDIFVNRKKIRQKGLFTFLLFDDPFYVRIDLISISLVIIVAILVILGNTIPGLAEAATSGGASAILNTVLCICCVMFCGGTTLTIEIVKKLRNRNAKKTSTELQDLLAENIDLLELLKEYASKEFSIENIELFSLLKSIKSETVSLSQLEDIEKDFIANFSKYEINLPSSTKHHFYKLLEECRNANLQQVSTQKLFDVIWNELIINILDTFGRLEQTAQYKEWLSIKTMQENRGLK